MIAVEDRCGATVLELVACIRDQSNWIINHGVEEYSLKRINVLCDVLGCKAEFTDEMRQYYKGVLENMV